MSVDLMQVRIQI
jgi:hypothetical protein